MGSVSEVLWSNSEFINILGNSLNKYFNQFNYKQTLINLNPRNVYFDMYRLLQYLDLGSYTSMFFDSLNEKLGYDNFLLFSKSILDDWMVSKDYFIYIKKIEKHIGITPIEELDSKHFGKVISIRCVIKNMTDRLMKIIYYVCNCGMCGEENLRINITSDYIPTRLVKNKKCPKCGMRGLYLKDKVKTPVIRLKLETITDGSETQQKTSSIYAEMKESVVKYFVKSNINVGDRVIITGNLIDNPTTKNEAISQFFMNILSVEKDTDKETFEKLTKEHIEEIMQEVQKKDFLEKLKRSIAPKIEGYSDPKLSLIIQELSGINKDVKVWENRTVKKGFVNIIFAGDPATAKTQLVKFMLQVCPKIYFSSGDQTTIAGLLGAVFQDPMMNNEWTLSAGALSLANKGTIAIDELNKLDSSEISRLNQVLSDYAVPFDKAKINTTIYTEVKLLGIMNPQGDVWSNKNINRQKIMELNLKKAFTTRISLIFPFFEDDLDDINKIENALKRQQGFVIDKDVYSPSFIKRFFIYAKRKKVKFDKERLIKEQLKFYQEIYKPKVKTIYEDDLDSYESPQKPAKMRLFDSYESILSGLARTNITDKDYCEPLDFHYEITSYLLENYYLSMFLKTHEKYWNEVGINIKKIKYTKKDKIFDLIKFIKTPKEDNSLLYSYEEIWNKWKEYEKDSNQIDFDDMLNKLKHNGELIEPKSGYFQAM